MSLVVEGITKRYGGLVAVNNVSFTAEAERITAVIGPNGAGKTTLLNLISGVVPPNSGQVQLFGDNVTGKLPHDIAVGGLARTYQSPQLFEGMTVLETVMVGAHIHGHAGLLTSAFRTRGVRRDEANLEDRARRALDRTHLSGRDLNRIAVDLPYGLQRRVEIARALAMDAKALLLDEPAAGLNASETAELSDLISHLSTTGHVIVLVEHDMDMVMGISDKLVVMNFGQKLAEGSPEEIQNNPAVIEAYLGGVEEMANA